MFFIFLQLEDLFSVLEIDQEEFLFCPIIAVKNNLEVINQINFLCLPSPST